MKNQILSAIALTACLTSAKAQQANPSPASPPAGQVPVEQRVDKLESDIGQILQILKAQQQAPAAPSTTPPSSQASTPDPAAPAPPTAAPQAAQAQQTANLKPGAILELWVLKPDFAGDAPLGRSIGAMIDNGEYFRMANFLEDTAFSGQQTNRVAIKWNGFIKIKEAGTHVFTLELSKPDTNYSNKGHLTTGIYGHHNLTISWVADFSISDQSIIKQTTEGDKADSETQVSDSAEVEMQPGYFPLSLLTFFNVANNQQVKWNYANPKITLKVRGPSDMKPRTLTSSDLFHKE